MIGVVGFRLRDLDLLRMVELPEPSWTRRPQGRRDRAKVTLRPADAPPTRAQRRAVRSQMGRKARAQADVARAVDLIKATKNPVTRQGLTQRERNTGLALCKRYGVEIIP